MFILAVTLLTISSESVRQVLEDSVANASLFMADNMVLILACLATTCVLFSTMGLTAKDKTHAKALPPVVPYWIPVIGNFIQFAKHPVDFAYNAFQQHGPCFTANMFGQSLTFLIGPDAHVPFFRANDRVLDSSSVYGFMTPVFGEGLIYDATPKRRAQQFQFMANGLKTARLVTYVEKIRQEADMYFRSWSSSGTVSLYKSFCEVTILTASRALLGDEVRENLFAEVAKLYSDLDKGTTAFSFFFPYAPIPAHKKRDQARIEMVKLFSKVIRDRREKGIKADDILQTFMDAEYKDAPGSPIPDDHIVGLLIGLLFAGQHTSSSTLTWTLLHIMSNPDILKRVLEEQDQVLGNGNTVSLETLGEMKLLHACIKESLRLNPPLIFVMRRVMQDINFEQYKIPEGHIVVTSPAVAGKLDESWSDSTKFDPDRFLDERGEESRKPFTYVAFGGGMHGCMGQQYAYLQIKTVLSVLLRQYSLELLDTRLPPPDYTNLVVIPSGPCNAKFNRRD